MLPGIPRGWIERRRDASGDLGSLLAEMDTIANDGGQRPPIPLRCRSSAALRSPAIGAARAPRLSVVVPVRNEAGNVASLVAEIEAALMPLAPFEVIYVDDGSSDATAAEVERLREPRPWLRLIRHTSCCGQSAAIRSGVRAACADVIVSIDGDGQNDPAFIPALAAALVAAGPTCGLVQGRRIARKASVSKRLQSRIANAVRAGILHDGARDSGCGLKCFRRDVYLALPFFEALHRFMPALVQREGYTVASVDVVDRPRRAGSSNYGLFDRLWVGIPDLLGVRWLMTRSKPPPVLAEAPPWRGPIVRPGASDVAAAASGHTIAGESPHACQPSVSRPLPR